MQPKLHFVLVNQERYIAPFLYRSKKNKDDEPLWLNCKVFGNELASKLESEVKKGSKVLVGGFFKTSQSEEREFLNFIVMNYTVLQDPVSRGESYDS